MAPNNKKKHWCRDTTDTNRISLISLHILYCLIFRHHYLRPCPHRCRLHPILLLLLLPRFLPFFLLFFFAFFLFFPSLPPPSISNFPSSLTPMHLLVKLNNSSQVTTNGRVGPGPGNVFRIPAVFGVRGGRDLWTTNQSTLFHGCSHASSHFLKRGWPNTDPNRYLLIATSGGLNQQRTGIVDAVVAAYILNATLVVPKLDQNSFWKDDSNFSDIFDVEWFISFLSKQVKIVEQLPENATRFTATRAPRKCNQTCYETRILPLYHKKRVQTILLTKFDFRLSNQLDHDLQKLRCRVNYHALRFTNPILDLGRKLAERMRKKSNHFVALHLRFEPDMLAFTGCYYGGGEKEILELGKIRKRWKTLHKKNPDRERRLGKCPLSPEEVGVMLRALGYGNEVHIYVASGEVYGGEETLAPLRALFPNFHSKETLASKEELAQFSAYSSRRAALDFIVCDESDVFVTNNNGNMAKILAGKRRYFGHKRTIRPNAKKLQQLLGDREKMGWEEFALQVETTQIGLMGEANEVKAGRGCSTSTHCHAYVETQNPQVMMITTLTHQHKIKKRTITIIYNPTIQAAAAHGKVRMKKKQVMKRSNIYVNSEAEYSQG